MTEAYDNTTPPSARRALLALFAVVFLSVIAARAQAVEAMPDIVVTGVRAGPGLWHVHRGSAQLWILGTVAPLPKDMTWRSRRIDRLLGGIDSVVVGKPFRVGILRIVWLLITQRDLVMVPAGRKLRDVLPPDLYARFSAQRAKLTHGSDKWERYRPIIAAGLLQEAALRSVGLSTRLEVGAEVRKLARSHGVRVDEFQVAGIGAALDALRTLPAATEQKCVAAMLATVESGLPRLVARADAWAVGDIKRIQALPEDAEVDACRSAIEGGGGPAAFLQRIQGAWLAQLDAHLVSGGRTLAVVNMDLLLRRGGLLDELRAQGYQVDAPQ